MSNIKVQLETTKSLRNRADALNVLADDLDNHYFAVDILTVDQRAANFIRIIDKYVDAVGGVS